MLYRDFNSEENVQKRVLFRKPFIVYLAGMRNKHISFKVDGKKAMIPGDGGDGGKGGFGGGAGRAYVIGVKQKPKTLILDKNGLNMFQ